MDLKTLKHTPAWDWSEGASTTFLNVIRDTRAAEPDRLLAVELAGDLVAMNDEPAGALLTVLRSDVKPEKLHAKAAISLGPVLEQADTDGFEDMDDQPIPERTFHAIQETLRKTHLDGDVPQEVRRRALEASVRARQDWHRDAIRAVFNSGDEAWQPTAIFCNALPARFRGGDPGGAGENPDIQCEAVCTADNWEVNAAWPHISPPSRLLPGRRPAADFGLDTPVRRWSRPRRLGFAWFLASVRPGPWPGHPLRHGRPAAGDLHLPTVAGRTSSVGRSGARPIAA